MTLLDPAPPADPGPPVVPALPAYGAHRGRPGLGSAVLLGVLLVAGWFAAIAVAVTVQTPGRVHEAALFLHLAFLIAGFGAVLTLDWFGLLWATGRKTLAEVADVADAAHLLIWIGLLGLTATGMLLEPSLRFWTCVKLAAVLVVALNGINAMRLNHHLAGLVGAPSRRLLAWSTATALVSQVGWWTACAIGFVNAH